MPTRRKALLLAAAALGVAAIGFGVWWLLRPTRNPVAKVVGSTLELRIKNPAGRPAVGAHARVMIDGKPRDLAVGTTGVVTVRAFAPVTVTVVVRLRAAARAVRTLALKPGTQRVEIALVPELVARGRVVDDLNQGIAQAQIRARSLAVPEPTPELARELIIEATSIADGGFELHELAAGSYAIEASADYHDTAALPAVEIPRTDSIAITLPRTSALRGDVVDENGTPAPRALVTIAGSGVWPPKTISSDEHGQFRFERVPAGVYELRATRENAITPPQEGLVLEPGKEGYARLQLQPGATLAGRVLDVSDAHPLAGVEVTINEEALSAAPRALKTDAQGEFRASGLRMLPHRVFIQPRGYVPVYGELRTPGPDAYEFALERAATLAGQVVDEQGRPVADAELEVTGSTASGLPLIVLPPLDPNARGGFPGATVAATPTADNLGVTAGVVPMVPLVAMPGAAAQGPSAGFRSDTTGNFKIEGVPPGQVAVVARHAGFAPGRSDPRATASGVLSEGLRVVLPRGATLLGRVLDAREFPASGVRVQVELQGEPTRVAISADDGRFELDALHGRCMITAYPLQGAPVRTQVEFTAGERSEVTLRLSGDVRDLAGRVRDARGIPIARARVTVDAANTRAPLPRTATSGDDGTFRIAGLPPPPYHVRVEHPSYAPTVLGSVSPGPQEELAIELAPGARLYGIVVDGLTNNGIPGVQVRLRGAQAKDAAQTATSAQGKFEISNLTIGKYDMFFEHAGHVSARAKLALLAPEARELDPVVMKPTGSVSGAVVDRLGAPVRDAEVALGNPPAWPRAVRTDRIGHFRIPDAEPGDRLVSARHYQAGASSDSVAVRVYPRQESPGLVLRLPGQI